MFLLLEYFFIQTSSLIEMSCVECPVTKGPVKHYSGCIVNGTCFDGLYYECAFQSTFLKKADYIDPPDDTWNIVTKDIFWCNLR